MHIFREYLSIMFKLKKTNPEIHTRRILYKGNRIPIKK